MDNDIRKQIGARIREAREHLGITQEQLAQQLNRHQNTVSSYENGTRTIKVTELPELARALNVQLAYFFGERLADDEILSIVKQLSPPFRAGILILARQQLELQKKLQATFGAGTPEDLAQAGEFVMNSEKEISRKTNQIFFDELTKQGFLNSPNDLKDDDDESDI